MPAISWMLRLQDLVSGPAGQIDRQIQALTQSIQALDIASKQARLDRTIDPLRRQRLEMQIQRDQMVQQKTALEYHAGLVQRLADRVRDARGAMRDWALIFFPVAKGIEFVTDQVRSMLSTIGDAIQTREGALLGLRANMGNEGVRFYEDMSKAAERYGRSVQEVIGLSRNLVELGATPRTARFLTAALEDIHARLPGRFQDVQRAVENMLSTPVLDKRNFRFATRGIMGDPNEFRRELGKQYGIAVPDVDQYMQENRLNNRSRNITAYLNTLRQLPGQNGRVGTLAEQFGSNTMEGLFGRIQSAGQNAFAAIEKSAGFRAFKDVLRNVASVLGGRETRGILIDVADKMAQFLKPLTGPEGKKSMEEFFASMRTGLQNLMPGLLEIVKATAFLAKWGILKPVQALGFGAQGGRLHGKTMEDIIPGLADDERARARGMVLNMPGSRDMDATNRGYAGAEVPVLGPGAARPNVTVHGPLVQINAPGATKDDAHDVSAKAAEAVRRELVRFTDSLSAESGTSQ